ncbi:HNH endonuclease signature motif containing protein [Aspergillus ibericus CBS 121593]|uniref:HNH nuclease domain-containing protein n=1 Tax=Aspergillus ibericus CBS 121593 TaxID=1448316 RepID=A0A395HCQ3_9EURO|nr:hypothetical protein BO80DRAFT_491260 [Aspergillus ibericus CBS 121593]RAL04004.1 hypothetical protein BO80DRAFT_491260 [Aspergillus ibericus CBS 121593]
MAAPHDRHRTSLEGVIVPELQPFPREDHEQSPEAEAVSETDSFLELFFSFIVSHLDGDSNDAASDLASILSYLDGFASWTRDDQNTLGESLVRFTEYLVDNFFLPLKALAAKTPQPTPASLSRAPLSNSGIGTPQRLSTLRRDCLVRDRHRCVVTRKFDIQEADRRLSRDGTDFKDDDGASLLPESDEMTFLEVAHIIPHSLMSLTSIDGEPQLAEPKLIAHKILTMFNPEAIPLISGSDIDRPKNALTLTQTLHMLFGKFEIGFEHIGPHTYKIDYIKPDRLLRIAKLPVIRTLYLTPNRTIEPPSVELLQIHHAIARILHLSGAGEYIDRFLRDMEEMEAGPVDANGSSRIDDYVRFKLWDQFEMSVC